MPSNKYTRQDPLSATTVRQVLAERVYVGKANPQAYSDPTARTDGTDSGILSNWNDLGIVMNSAVQLSYNKETKYIETGIEKVRRGVYITGKTAQAQFTLEQFDWNVLQYVSGITAGTFTHNTSITGHKMNFGADDVVTCSLLFIGTNKYDGMEIHTWCKSTVVNYSFVQNDDSRQLQVTADLLPFDDSGTSTFFKIYFMNAA